MKTKKGFKLRTVCGENIIVAEGLANIDFGRLITLNESAAFLWTKAVEQPAFTVDQLAQWLIDEYEVDQPTALKDAQALVENWLKIGIVE